jgi:phage-related protein (TIGR01555 family)
MRGDGWSNAFTGLGTTTYDKRLGGTFGSSSLSCSQEAEIWEGNALGARIVETWPNEMTREGWRLVVRGGEGAREIAEQVEAHHEEIGLVEAFWEALAFERAYGGGAVMLGARDFRDLMMPLEIGKVRSFDWVTTFDPSEMSPRYWYDDPRAPKFGAPSHYEILPYAEGPSQKGGAMPPSILVHESRLIVFRGHRVSRRRSMPGKLGFGQSTLGRIHGVLRDHNMGFDAAAILLHDFSQAVFKIKNLAESMAEDRDDEIKVRAQAVELSRSVARAIIIDSEEEFERKQTPITGLPETLDRFCAMLAAAADMPLTLLMGQSPGGLNATGESDVRFFYDRVKAAQVKRLRPALEKITALTFRVLGIEEPEQWSIEFNPLWQQSSKEIAEARKLQAETDQIYIDTMVLSPSDVSRSRFGGDGYSFDTDVDFDERDRLEAEQRELDRMAQEQSIESAKAAAGKKSEKPSVEE